MNDVICLGLAALFFAGSWWLVQRLGGGEAK
jgi:hypothetical protein